MEPSREDIVKHYVYDPDLVQRVAYRKVQTPLDIVDPDPTWPEQFEQLKARIESAIGPTMVSIAHVGSTSVPSLAAKAIIDIDLAVQDITDEASYVAALEAAGFHFLAREPLWWEHRFFCCYDPPAHLHVWPPSSPEMVRHRIMKEWLMEHEDDRELYVKAKKEASRVSKSEGETMMQYNLRKEQVIRAILEKALKHHGYI
ncbi:grpb/dephospho-CoA kinase [Stachybotrys elegans]|uniref:Grpb/dephospho-CoA kinase n=1 Tax=Stachybotrys elegans TaxID=80388 RepID=A0A8K0SRB1_9HYPO|nr:grpb/dephospho-CoA kinase [Stachybotrys elegans]